MPGLNKIMVIGNVGREPEMRYTPSGSAVTKFTLAVNRTFGGRDGGERKEETEWFTVEAWSRLAETTNQYVQKGRRLYVEGRLRSEPWVGKDGVARSGNVIVANDIQFLDQAGAPGTREPAGAPAEGDLEADDLPF